jgi:predicted nucleic acid-binding protein
MIWNENSPMADFFSQPIVCNTGPLIALSRANLGYLLPRLFSRVITTQEVVAELTAKDAGDADAVRQTLAHFEIVMTSTPDPLLVTELDAGEASVIQAARDHGITGVLIDERRARRIAAEAYGLEVRGTCAVLLRAKRMGELSSIKPVLETLVSNGYFIGPQLRLECLRQAGE